ncbi:hypothetical protein BJX76DRAFT_91761 [Aspergillus varians]
MFLHGFLSRYLVLSTFRMRLIVASAFLLHSGNCMSGAPESVIVGQLFLSLFLTVELFLFSFLSFFFPP